MALFGNNERAAVWATALRNVVALICWTFLSWYFGKWWISLISLLVIYFEGVNPPKQGG